jgi:5-methylcytosine-specific restriction endonuclease McrA
MTYTREQRRVYQAEYRKRRRNRAIELLGGKCSECGTTENLELNHIDPSQKRFSLGKWDGTAEEYWREVVKCNLLCHEHHVAETDRQRAAGLIDSRNVKYRN